MATQSFKVIVQRYIRGVMSGAIVVGRLVKLAVRRHVEDLKNATSRGFRFVESKASQAIQFSKLCCHSKGEWAGKPIELSPFQMFIVWVLMGWSRVSDGMRRFTKAFISMARKNGKSTFCAFLSLLLFVFDDPIEAGAEIYTAATKEQQASIIHGEAMRMVQQSPSLRKRISSTKNNLFIPSNFSIFRPLGSDSDKTDGLNPHGVFEDELHAWRERHRGLHEKLCSGGGSRRQPLLAIITTAGDDKSTIWKEEHDFACRCVESVLSGEVFSDTTFSFIACIDKDDDPFDEGNWPKANPNLDVSVKREFLRTEANDAKKDPTKLNKFLRYYANIQVSSTEKAIPAELWALGGSKPLSDLSHRGCHGGFDLGRSDDFASIGIVVPFDTGKEDEDGKVVKRFELKTQSWTCEEGSLDLTTEPYRTWIDRGLLRVCDGGDIDFADIEATIVEWSKLHDVKTWAYDPTFAHQMGQNLLNSYGLNVFEFTQAPKHYNEPIRLFLKALRGGLVNHGDDPCLGWQAGNLCIRRNAKDEWMPDKGDSIGKIDAVVAVLMGFSECLFSNKSSPTYYDNNPLEMV